MGSQELLHVCSLPFKGRGGGMGSQEVLHVCSLPFKGRVGVGMGRMGQFTFAPSLSRGGLGWGWVGKSIKLNTGGKQ